MRLRGMNADSREHGDGAGRRGMTILEVLVVASVIGLLTSIVLPAIQATREAARKTQCISQLRQIGLALHAYHEAWRSLPAGVQLEATQQSAFGWAVPLLSYVDQQPLYDSLDRGRTLGDAHNARARATPLAMWLCPSDLVQPVFELRADPALGLGTGVLVQLPTANYVAVYGVTEPDEDNPLAPQGQGAFAGVRPVSFAELSRGLSNTLLVGERTMAKVPSTWFGVDVRGEDAACRLLGNAATRPNCDVCDECEFDSRHSGGTNFLLGDGQVRFFSESMDSVAYREMARRSEN